MANQSGHDTIDPLHSDLPSEEVELPSFDSTDNVPDNDVQVMVTHPNESTEEMDEAIKHSDRQMTKPKRLHYVEFGNPII